MTSSFVCFLTRWFWAAHAVPWMRMFVLASLLAGPLLHLRKCLVFSQDEQAMRCSQTQSGAACHGFTKERQYTKATKRGNGRSPSRQRATIRSLSNLSTTVSLTYNDSWCITLHRSMLACWFVSRAAQKLAPWRLPSASNYTSSWCDFAWTIFVSSIVSSVVATVIATAISISRTLLLPSLHIYRSQGVIGLLASALVCDLSPDWQCQPVVAGTTRRSASDGTEAVGDATAPEAEARRDLAPANSARLLVSADSIFCTMRDSSFCVAPQDGM